MVKKRVTLKDVAAQAGVTYQTVSKVINGHARGLPATEERIRSATRQLGYKPNHSARSLRAQRSLITLALLTALNRPHELRVHVVGALRNGLTQEQIVEVVMHCAVYCGFPAALDAMRIVREVFAEQP